MQRQSENVEKTEQIFSQVKDGIDHSIDSVNIIADKTRNLDTARITVVDVVQNLTAIAEENAAGTEETSASTAELAIWWVIFREHLENFRTLPIHWKVI